MSTRRPPIGLSRCLKVLSFEAQAAGSPRSASRSPIKPERRTKASILGSSASHRIWPSAAVGFDQPRTLGRRRPVPVCRADLQTLHGDRAEGPSDRGLPHPTEVGWSTWMVRRECGLRPGNPNAILEAFKPGTGQRPSARYWRWCAASPGANGPHGRLRWSGTSPTGPGCDNRIGSVLTDTSYRLTPTCSAAGPTVESVHARGSHRDLRRDQAVD